MLIVFDLDGTLIDSQLDLAESANELLAGYGAGPLPVGDVARMVGDGARRLVERALAAVGLETDVVEALDRFLTIYDRRLLVHTRPYPGLVAAVKDAARRVPIGVLTNKPEKQTRTLIAAFALEADFRWVIGGDSAFPRKPDPTGLNHLVAAAGARPETTLLVGDSLVDVETARRAGTKMCVALYGFGHLREPLSLTGSGLVAEEPARISILIDQFLNAGSRPTG